MFTVQELAARLRALPQLMPDPVWGRRTKRKLLRAMSVPPGRLQTSQHWAIFATYEYDPINFALWVRAKGRDWRPLAINPERLATAVASIQPNVVVIDPRLPRREQLAGQVRAASMADTAFASDSELAHIA